MSYLNVLCRYLPVTKSPGVHEGISREIYDSIPALSATAIKRWIKTGSVPSVFKYWLDNRWDETPTESKLLGGALDTMKMEPDMFALRYATVPPGAPKRPSKAQINAKKPSPETLAAIAFWDRFNEETKGKTVLTTDQLTTVGAMNKALSIAPTTEGVFEHCHKAVLIGKVFGYPAKAEIDLWNPQSAHIMDVKSAQHVDPIGFLLAADRFDYFIQATWYLLLAQNLGFEKTVFDFIAVGNEEPYPVKVHPFVCNGSNIRHSLLFSAACARIKAASASLARALEDGKFIDDPDWQSMEIPEWMIARMDRSLDFASETYLTKEK